ncbi:MAG: polysaccharide biosynthesis C-terminal domain-containing protein [Lachnospiraceae bacterium]|nr:polysaccharide biosynthesis C-terminal domain-containing protein [Lachnospiraceae bacterium]
MNIQWMAKNLKNRIVLSAGIVSYMILLLLRIPLSRVIGDAGVGLFAPAFELFVLTTLVISYGMSNAMAGIIRYRVKRERYRNAGKVLRTAFVMNLFMGTVMALFVLFFSKWIAEVLVLERLSRMAVMAAAPSVFFAALVGIFRGYFNGYGMGVLTAHSQYIEKLAMFVGALLSGRAFYGYGQKVAALMQTEAHSYAYGALGAMIGVCISQVVALLHLLLVYVIYAGAFKGRPGQDNSRRAESRFEIQRMLVVNMVPLAAVAVLSNLFMIADQRYFNYCMNVTEQGNVRTAQWGCYYGKFAPLVGICAAVSCLFVHGLIGKISNAYEREEYRNMRERMGRAVRNVSMMSFPSAIYLAVLGKPFSVCCYGRTTAQSAVLAGWLSKGAVLAVLFAFSFLFGQILYRMRMARELFLAAAASFVVHLAAAYFMTQRGHMGVDGLLCALILLFGIYMVLAFVFLNRRIKYKPDWFKGILFPLAAAAASGLVVYLINRLLSGIAGAALCIIISLFVGVFLHVLFLVLLRVINETELQEMPFGFLFIALGRTTGIL